MSYGPAGPFLLAMVTRHGGRAALPASPVAGGVAAKVEKSVRIIKITVYFL
jgi:hypothetical protein